MLSQSILDKTLFNMRVLLVEDNQSISNIIRMSLESECFAVDVAEDGNQGSFLARTNSYDIIILDNVLPKKLGVEVCIEIREAGITTPVLFLSMKNEVLNKINALNNGADDYLTKPFSHEELLARIKALLRRPKHIEERRLKTADIILDQDSGEVIKSEKSLYLTRKEYSVLELLLKNKNKLVSRGQILEYAWDQNANPFSNTIEAHILSLRRKIGDRSKKIIRSVPGRGYKLVEN